MIELLFWSSVISLSPLAISLAIRLVSLSHGMLSRHLVFRFLHSRYGTPGNRCHGH
jgi:hypothetical protein